MPAAITWPVVDSPTFLLLRTRSHGREWQAFRTHELRTRTWRCRHEDELTQTVPCPFVFSIVYYVFRYVLYFFCRYFYFFFHFSVLLRQCFLSWPIPAMPTLSRPTEAYIYLVLFRRMMRLYKTSFLCLFITVVFRVWLSGRRLRST